MRESFCTNLCSTTFKWNATSGQDSIILDCKGLDTAASVYLNGNLLGTTDNMFTRYKFEIGKSLQANNTLLIAFESPVTHAEKAYELQGHDSIDRNLSYIQGDRGGRVPWLC